MRTTNPFELWIAKDCWGNHGRRPVVVISPGEGDDCPVTVVPLTSNRETTQLPTHVLLSGQGLDYISRALCERVTTIPRQILIRRIGQIFEPYDRFALRHALAIHLGLQTEEGILSWN